MLSGLYLQEKLSLPPGSLPPVTRKNGRGIIPRAFGWFGLSQPGCSFEPTQSSLPQIVKNKPALVPFLIDRTLSQPVKKLSRIVASNRQVIDNKSQHTFSACSSL